MIGLTYKKTVYFSDKQSFLLSIKKQFDLDKLIITQDKVFIAKVIKVQINKTQTLLKLFLDNNDIIEYII